jgi:hypothetical protein
VSQTKSKKFPKIIGKRAKLKEIKEFHTFWEYLKPLINHS